MGVAAGSRLVGGYGMFDRVMAIAAHAHRGDVLERADGVGFVGLGHDENLGKM